MARRLRVAPGGVVYHVLNRRVGRQELFDKDGDFLAFEKILAQAHDRYPTRLLTYCLMRNHWHMVVQPTQDGELSEYIRWISVTHTQRWHAHHGTTGTGPLYQGRFKSFPVQDDRHFLIVCRYVERNPLRAGKVEKAQDWVYCGLRRRRTPKTVPWLTPIEDWPVETPRDWLGFVNRAETPAELEALRQSIRRGRPFGDDEWQHHSAERMKLQSSLNPTHRPPNSMNEDDKDS